MLCDAVTEDLRRPIGFGKAVWCFYDGNDYQPWPYRTGLRHSGGDNFCFVDGHAKWSEVESAKEAVSSSEPYIWTWNDISFLLDY